MEWNTLCESVCGFWGMSEWTASILAIFHFGHEDVYPNGDGSLRRAEKLVSMMRFDDDYRIRSDLAAPYRSYLALYLWKALDEGYLSKPEAS